MKKLTISLVTIALGMCSTSAFAAKEKANKSSVKVRDINKNPASYMDKKVSLRGEVEEMVSPQAFVLDGEGIFNDRILVISEKTAQPPKGKERAGTAALDVQEDDKVQVSGTVRRLTVVEVEKEYGMDLKPELEAEFEESMPVVVTKMGDIQKTSS